MDEIWKDIENYEGLYQVSNLGRVKSLARVVEYSDGRSRTQKERILKPSPDNGGYLRVELSKAGKQNTERVHRLVALAFIPNPDNKATVDHRYGNKEDNSVSNLRWATYGQQHLWAYNEQELKEKPKGQNNGNSKLSNDEAEAIITELSAGNRKLKEIAIDYNTTIATVSHINTGRNWLHLLPDLQRPIRKKNKIK